MKTILVDAIQTLVNEDGSIFTAMHELLERFPNRKIILTMANDEEMQKFGLDKAPYEVFTSKHDPDKSDPEYYRQVLSQFGLSADGVVYFEHGPAAVESAESVGIKTYYYDPGKKDLAALEHFLSGSLNA